MDIAYYVSELLGELGEVNVPGLGNFTQRKIDGYYSDAESKFYPPVSEVRFHPHFAEDDILAEYIAEKKKISIASSKYFTEKYVNAVKQEAILQDVALADMGSLRFVVHEFHFKSAGTWANDPLFFAYPQIELKKLSSAAFLDQVEALTLVPEQEVLPHVLHEEPIHEAEEVSPVLTEEPVPDTEAVSPSVLPEEPVHETEAVTPPVLDEESVHTPEIITTDEAINEPEKVVSAEHELPSPILPDEPVKEAEAVEAEELVKEPEPQEFDLEAYLRELETGAGIIQPQEAFQEAGPEVISPQPPAEIIREPEPEQEIAEPEALTEPELKVQEPIIMDVPLPEPGPVITEPEPLAEPEPQVHEHIDVPLPEAERAPYAPDPELQKYILESTPVVPQPAPELTAGHEEDFVFNGKGYDDVDNINSHKGSYVWLWISLVIIVLLGAGAGYVWYMHQQKVLKIIKENSLPLPLKIPIKQDTLNKTNADSLKDTTQATVIQDTTEKPVGALAGTTTIDSSKARYEVMGASATTIKDANDIIRNYKSLGFDSHIVNGAPGKRLKISLGTYSTHRQALQKERDLIKTGKVQKDIYILPINPKK